MDTARFVLSIPQLSPRADFRCSGATGSADAPLKGRLHISSKNSFYPAVYT
jgi:hypothetical protein